MSYLDETGLSYFWGKIKSLVSSKMDKSTYDPQNKAQDVFGYVDSVAEGLIEYVDFTVTEESVDNSVIASSRSFDEVMALLEAGTTVIGRAVRTTDSGTSTIFLTVSSAYDTELSRDIVFFGGYCNYHYSNYISVNMDPEKSVLRMYIRPNLPLPSEESDIGKILMVQQNGGPDWSPMPTAGELGALPISGGTMTGPLTLSGDPAEDLQAAPKQYVDKLGLPIVTTEGDGAAYTATVPGITALTAGASFIMIPHTVSTSTTPTLNVNSLGAKNIKRGLSSLSSSNSVGYSSSWLVAGYPLLMVYDGTLWKVVNMTKPTAQDLNGTVSVSNGGTGYTSITDTTYTTARYRASSLNSSDTTPSSNGVIAWTYE